MVDKLWKQFLLTTRPGEVMIVRDVDHVVCVNSAKRGKTVTDNGEKGDEDVIDYVDNVLLATFDVDPAD